MRRKMKMSYGAKQRWFFPDTPLQKGEERVEMDAQLEHHVLLNRGRRVANR